MHIVVIIQNLVLKKCLYVYNYHYLYNHEYINILKILNIHTYKNSLKNYFQIKLYVEVLKKPYL